MEDEEVVGFYFHGAMRRKSGRPVCNGELEFLGAADSSYLYCYHAFPSVENEMRMQFSFTIEVRQIG
jgi:hypothetical protein